MGSKQIKVIKAINHKPNNDIRNVINIKFNPNDECFTSLQDIINELWHWKEKFKDKNIICPCDWDINDDDDIYSMHIMFEKDTVHGHINNVAKKITYKIIKNDNEWVEKKIEGLSAIDTFLRTKIKCNFIHTFVQMANEWKIKSITASGYNPKLGKGIKFQDVDFTKYDICVTNPPFSVYGEFLETLISSRIDFIVLAPLLNRASPSVGLPLTLRQCFLGYNRDKSLDFYNPTSSNDYKTKKVAVDWITTFDNAQKELNKKYLTTGIKYELYKDEFPIMIGMTMKDGTHPIRINKINAIPDDYNGWMFCSIGVLDRISYDEFDWYLTGVKKYYNKTNPNKNPFSHNATNTMLKDSNGRQYFHGIVMKRRQTN